MRTSAVLVLLILVGCSREPAFEVLGVTLDRTTIQEALVIHPGLKCRQAQADEWLPSGYQTCMARDIDAAKNRSNLYLDFNEKGLVESILLLGQPYDGPLSTWEKAMNEKYGSPERLQNGELRWARSGGTATLKPMTSSEKGYAALTFSSASRLAKQEKEDELRIKGARF